MENSQLALFSEQKAVHNALLEMGFVYIGKNNLYVLSSDHGDIPLAGSICSSFDSVVKRLGAVYFNKKFSIPALRKSYFRLSQELMDHARFWQDLQDIRAAVGHVKKKI